MVETSIANKNTQVSEKEVALSDIKILFFNEQKEYLKHFTTIFRMCGLRHVRVATQMSEAINLLITKNFDVILITHLGESENADLLIEELNSLEGTAEIPVAVITTSRGGVKNILGIYSKGVDEVIVSPLSFKSIENTLNQLVQTGVQTNLSKKKLTETREFKEAGETEKALAGFNQMVIENEYLFEAHLGLSQIYRAQENWKRTSVHIKKAFEVTKARGDKTLLDKAKTYRDLAVVYHNYAEYYQGRGQTEKALKNYRFAVKLNPFYIDSIIAILGFMRKPEEVEAINKMIEEIVNVFVPYSSPLETIAIELEKLSQKFIRLNMPDNAMAIHRQIIKIYHTNSDVCLANADFLLELGEVSAVIKKMMEFVKRITDTDVLVKAANIFLEVEKEHISGSGADKLKGKDLSYFKGMKKDEIITAAKEMFQQSLLIDPDNQERWIDILDCYLRLKDDTKTTELADKLTKDETVDASLYASVIKIIMDNRRFDVVAGYLKDALKRFPDNDLLYEYQAVYYKEQGQPYEAISFLKKAYNIQPDRPDLLLLLAETYYEIQDYSNAISFYEKAKGFLGTDQRVEKGLQKALVAKQNANGKS